MLSSHFSQLVPSDTLVHGIERASQSNGKTKQPHLPMHSARDAKKKKELKIIKLVACHHAGIRFLELVPPDTLPFSANPV